MQGLFPDARGPEDDAAAPSDTSGVFLDIHSHGRLILWPWGHTDTTAPNGTQLQTLGRKLAFFNGHTPQQAIGLYPATGTTDDYGYGELGIASYTFELGTSFFQDCDSFEETIVPQNVQSLRYALKVARTPYMTPAGPDAVDVDVNAGSVSPDVLPVTPVTLSATLTDERYSEENGTEPEQNIAAGEYYVDVPPWGKNPSAIPLAAVDGVFDETEEDATASIDTTGWSPGRHIIFVRAKDAADNWGAFSSALLFISEQSEAAAVVSIVRHTPPAAVTNADSLTWQVVFSKAVGEVDEADFVVSGTSADVTSVSGSATTWRVTVSGGNLATANGQVSLAFAANQNIEAADGNALDATLPSGTNYQSYMLDNMPPPPPPPPPRGGGGGVSRDLHGNTPTRATRVRLGRTAPWASSTAGQINTADDIDYFSLSLPQAGVLVVETTGQTDTVGTVWRDGEELASTDSGGERRNFRLHTRVDAGSVLVAVESSRSRTGAYTLETRLLAGYLENPGMDSFQSGIGVISGWVCEAEEVVIEINGTADPAAYGTERLDTERVCGDTDNGFGVLFNWNLLGDGTHTVVALVDGVELGRATVTVTTLGEEFLKDVASECEVPDFPTVGEMVTLVWQQTSQNFVIASGNPPDGDNAARSGDLEGYLENPGPNSFQSGIGIISGWVCDAETVEIVIGDLAPQVASYGTERLDTEAACGDTDNGFGLLFNWNLLGDGTHPIVALVDEIELGRATVQVTTLGHEFLRGAEGACVVDDFSILGKKVTLEWQQNSQNFVITEVE